MNLSVTVQRPICKCMVIFTDNRKRIEYVNIIADVCTPKTLPRIVFTSKLFACVVGIQKNKEEII